MAKKQIERYYSLKSVQGPENQIGVAIRASSQLTLEDMTRLFSFVKKDKNKGYQDYEANTNVDIYGQDNKDERDIIGLRVFADSRVEICKQADYPMKIAEIDKELAEEAARRMAITRQQDREPRVISVSPGNPSLGLPAGVWRY
ncbi:MAG: hypothetical protein Q8N99_05385 [Nanoarchaeota archaeon]|nr:hypothetical protein [Nanoarchaeota archaeon]